MSAFLRVARAPFNSDAVHAFDRYHHQCVSSRHLSFDVGYLAARVIARAVPSIVQKGLNEPNSRIGRVISKVTPGTGLSWLEKNNLSKKQFGHYGQNIIIRNRNKPNELIPDLKLTQKTTKRYEELPADSKIGVIVNIGRKKKGKSFNASMSSLYLTAKGCHFTTGNSRQHETVGFDISPPLELAPRLKEQYQNLLNYLCMIDFEGSDSENAVIVELMRAVTKYPCMVVLSCTDGIGDEDVSLCLQALNAFAEQKAYPKRSIFIPLSLKRESIPWIEHEQCPELAKLRDQVKDANCRHCDVYDVPDISWKNHEQIAKEMSQHETVSENPFACFDVAQYDQYKKMMLDMEKEFLSDLGSYPVSPADIIQLVNQDVAFVLDENNKKAN